MFGRSQNSDMLKIGERNATAGLAILRQLSIPVQANDTGGTHGRTIELNIFYTKTPKYNLEDIVIEFCFARRINNGNSLNR
jgi:chemotaxis receptor (MCP) glutamine deamidase CheD